MSRGRRNENFGSPSSSYDGILDDDLLLDDNPLFPLSPGSGDQLSLLSPRSGDPFSPLSPRSGDSPFPASGQSNSRGSSNAAVPDTGSSNAVKRRVQTSSQGQQSQLTQRFPQPKQRSSPKRRSPNSSESKTSSRYEQMKKEKNELLEKYKALKAKRNTRSNNACMKFHNLEKQRNPGKSTLIQTLFAIAVSRHKRNIDAHVKMIVDKLPFDTSAELRKWQTELAREQANNDADKAVYFMYTRADGQTHQYRTVSGKDKNAFKYRKKANDKGFFTVKLDAKHVGDFNSTRFNDCVKASFKEYTDKNAKQWFEQLNGGPYIPQRKCMIKPQFRNNIAQVVAEPLALTDPAKAAAQPQVDLNAQGQIHAVDQNAAFPPVVPYRSSEFGPGEFGLGGGRNAPNKTRHASVPFIQRVQSPRPLPAHHHKQRARHSAEQQASYKIPSKSVSQRLKSPLRKKTSTKSSGRPVKSPRQGLKNKTSSRR